eukprot:15295897-Alexandrium_andersonii.AAC.1
MVEAHGGTHAWRAGIPPAGRPAAAGPRAPPAAPSLRRRWEVACPAACQRLARAAQAQPVVSADGAN